ncbi:MAG TPA: 1,4-alpha-glucan branching protein GlgB [Rhodocyclaceae bacterium]|nr:1,4-alpha-glucan branching protein GlgB [Rhodocyclaceae bacterium]
MRNDDVRDNDTAVMSRPRTATGKRDDVERLRNGRHGDAFSFLGAHQLDDHVIVRVFLPHARAVTLLSRDANTTLGEFSAIGADGLFVIELASLVPYALRIEWPGGVEIAEDPYSFGAALGDLDIHLIAEGRHRDLGHCLGAQTMSIDGVEGVRFAVWAPNAMRVSVVGDFNSWDGRRHPMRLRHGAGVWEIFLPRVAEGARYKYEVIDNRGRLLPLKADPVALQSELPPSTASVVADTAALHWTDQDWMARRAACQTTTAPISIYEVHAASWMRLDNGRSPNWSELADRLVPYVVDMGFTHIELLPIMEHPFGGSWGYQPLGIFSPSARYGTPRDFARFVDKCHAAGIGVILDWVPAHFPTDEHGLMLFDGTALYEYADPREGWHVDWNTLIYNFGRHEVRGFLIASALLWLEHYHCDGLRVDAVASMLYRDYSRNANAWVPNIYGGRENIEAVAFLRELNQAVHERCPGTLMIAEESTAWPGVTAPVEKGGLGFSFKWNMGWMHDSLHYMARDPIHRRYHHDEMTFSLVYAYSEHYILPLSHDEVVHGKSTLIGRMPGDDWRRFANLRAYLGFMWTHPGKKLLFMGGEFAQTEEWNHDSQLNWNLLNYLPHQGVQQLVRDLNRLYRAEPALHRNDSDPAGFAWLIVDDRDNSVFAFLRRAGSDAAPILVVCNMTPVVRYDYRIGLPRPGAWQEMLNSDSYLYGGANNGNNGRVIASAHPFHDKPASIGLTLPPLATLILREEQPA